MFISKSESEFDEFLVDDNEDNDRVEDADFVLVRLHNILIFFSFKFILYNYNTLIELKINLKFDLKIYIIIINIVRKKINYFFFC